MLSNNTYYNSQLNTLPSPPQQNVMAENKMSAEQHKYCSAMMRNLKKHRDATPFLKPVDYIKLNVPDYPNIVKKPMDLLLVDSKLNAFEYNTVEEFVSDVRLIFNNCFKYNGPEAMISVLCQNVESAFEKGLRQMPMIESPPISQHNSPSPLIDLCSEDLKRPKREIHCPSKDYPETFTKQNKLSLTNKGEMKYCLQVLKELKKNKYRNQMYPFMLPVDPIALNLPDYTTIIKQPMDLSTIENKLLNDQYNCPEQFQQDIILMFNNCYLYNPPSLPIYSMAKEMEKVFNDKWDQKPTIIIKKKKIPINNMNIKRKKSIINDSSFSSSSSSLLVDKEIAKLERSIKNISKQVQSMKNPTIKKKRKPLYQFTFNQKKELSREINELDSDRLNAVVDIIKNSMPDLGVNDQKEIELDIDSLDNNTLHQLHNAIHSKKVVNNNNNKKRKVHYSVKPADLTTHDSSDSSSSEDDDSGSSDSDSDSD